jgi:hypothetical protein
LHFMRPQTRRPGARRHGYGDSVAESPQRHAAGPPVVRTPWRDAGGVRERLPLASRNRGGCRLTVTGAFGGALRSRAGLACSTPGSSAARVDLRGSGFSRESRRVGRVAVMQSRNASRRWKPDYTGRRRSATKKFCLCVRFSARVIVTGMSCFYAHQAFVPVSFGDACAPAGVLRKL